MNKDQVRELILQSLEHEMGGVMLYEVAISAALNEQLRQRWQAYLEQTRRHVRVLQDIVQLMGIDTAAMSPGRAVLSELAKSLMVCIDAARQSDPVAGELVACECIVLAETKDHLDWELLSEVAKQLEGEVANMMQIACEEVENEEDEHLYVTHRWCRELWLESLGLKAVLPPPEQRQGARNAAQAVRAGLDRKETAGVQKV